MNALLVIAKRPAPGHTKTRLSPPLTPAQASALYEGFLRDTLDIARAVRRVERILYYAPDDAESYFAELAPDFQRLPQVGADLGERLDHALTHCLAAGYERVVVMDSDSPTLPSACVAQAFDELARHEVVLGPCADGGYYLIGLTRPQPGLLRAVQMSQPDVLRDTVALAEAAGLGVALLPRWYDVDTADELLQLNSDLVCSHAVKARHTQALLAQMALAPQS